MIAEASYGKFKYLLYDPDHLEGKGKFGLPMVVVLHGSGEIGSSLSKLRKREPYLSLKNGKFKPDCWVLMPQLPKGTWGKMAPDLIDLCNFVQDAVGADSQRVSVTGHSLGAMGVIEIMRKYPGYFSAGGALSCCKDYSSQLHELSHMPLWFIYGAKESTYGKYARAMYNKMSSLNSSSNLTNIPKYGHPIQFVWTSERYRVFNWLTSFKVGDLKYPTWEWLLRDLNILDEEGRLNQNLLNQEINDPVAEAFALRKGSFWPL
jgi:predicted peptidase